MGSTGILVRVTASLERQALGVLGGADAGRQRVAGINRHVHDAAALHAVLGTAGPCGKDFALEVAVVVRVGIDEAADGAVLGRHLGLDAAPRTAVARDHDGALDGDAQAVELLVVVGHAVVDVDQRRGDVAIDRVGVVGGQLLVVLARRWDRRRTAGSASLAVNVRGLDQFQRRAPWGWGRARRRSRCGRPGPTP